MLYRQTSGTYIKKINNLGYIFSATLYKEEIVDECGAVFLSALSREPQSLEQLADNILKSFNDADKETVKNDSKEFYDKLVEEEFLVKADTVEELNQNEKKIKYQITKRTEFPTLQPGEISASDAFNSSLSENPVLMSFQIELTSKCNERCIHCYIPNECKIHHMEDELFYNVVKQLKELNVFNVTLSGGECMAHPKFKEYLRYLKQEGFFVVILSNLTLLNDEIIQIMKENSAVNVRTSLYSMNPEHHDKITQLKESFEKTKTAILKLLENDIPVEVNCPVMKINKDDYEQVLAWCTEHNIRSHADYIMMAKCDGDTSNLENRLSLEEASKIISNIVNGDSHIQNLILAPTFEDTCKKLQFNPDRKLCGAGVSYICMESDGSVYPCPGWQSMIIGDLNKTALSEIWIYSDKLKWLRSLKMKDMGKGKCCNCDKAAFCSPCMVRNSNESRLNNPLEINEYFCQLAEVNKIILLEWRKAKK